MTYLGHNYLKNAFISREMCIRDRVISSCEIRNCSFVVTEIGMQMTVDVVRNSTKNMFIDEKFICVYMHFSLYNMKVIKNMVSFTPGI